MRLFLTAALAAVSLLASTAAPAQLSSMSTPPASVGTAGVANTGTSGHTIPYLDGTNTFSGVNTFAGIINPTYQASSFAFKNLAGSTTYANLSSSVLELPATGGSFPGLSSNGDAALWSAASWGASLAGDGSTTDVQILNAAGSFALYVPHNTTNIVIAGSLGVGGVTAFNTSGVLQAASFPALTGDVTTSAGALGTTIAAGSVSLAKQANFAATSLQGNPTGSPAAPSAITLAGGLGFSGTTLTAAGALTPTSVASSGAISGTSIAGTTTILSSGATSGIGYATGAGGAITQLTSRTTGVTLNKVCGAITLVSAAGSATASSFTVTDSAVAATDVVVVNQKSGTDKYLSEVTNVAAGSFAITSQTTGGTTTETPVFNFCVIKGVAA